MKTINIAGPVVALGFVVILAGAGAWWQELWTNTTKERELEAKIAHLASQVHALEIRHQSDVSALNALRQEVAHRNVRSGLQTNATLGDFELSEADSRELAAEAFSHDARAPLDDNTWLRLRNTAPAGKEPREPLSF